MDKQNNIVDENNETEVTLTETEIALTD